MQKVLVVDDSAFVRAQVRTALAALGVVVIEAGDGVDALAMLGQHEIALLITDFMMPRMTGLELIEQMRSSPATACIATLILSTQATSNFVEHGAALGVRAWLKKPFKAPMLLAAVASLLAERAA